MINFLDVAAPEVDPGVNANPIIVVVMVVVLLAIIIFIGTKIKEKK